MLQIRYLAIGKCKIWGSGDSDSEGYGLGYVTPDYARFGVLMIVIVKGTVSGM
jgi:hypothetical protein